MNESIVSEPMSAGEAISSFKKYLPISIVASAIGGAGLIAYIVLATIFGGDGLFGGPAWVSAFLIFALPFTLGLIFALSIRSLEKLKGTLKDDFFSCEFFSDCFLITESRGGENMSVRKEFYGNIVRAKLKGGCILTYASDGNMVPAKISNLSAEQLNTLKKLFNLPLEEGAKTLELGSCDKL